MYMRWDDLKCTADNVLNSLKDVFGEVRIEQVVTWVAVAQKKTLSRLYSTVQENVHISLYSGERKASLYVPGEHAAALKDLLPYLRTRNRADPSWIDQVETEGCHLHLDEVLNPAEEAISMVGYSDMSSLQERGYRIGEVARCGTLRKAYMNTLGAESECCLPFSEYNVFARGGKIEFYYSGYVNRSPQQSRDMQDAVITYCETVCKALLSAQKVTLKSCPLVLDFVPFSVIVHEVFGHLLEYDLAVKTCFKADDRGTSIAPDGITIEDIPAVKNVLYIPFDDEGTVGREALLVDKGVLREFLVDRKTAHEIKQSPKGNSRAESATVSPMIRSRTTVLKEGTHTFEELLEEAEGGLYLYGVYRVDAHPDGTFTLGIPLAYPIHHGELGDPLLGVRISGNLFDFLEKIAALGKVSAFQISHCSKGTGSTIQDVKVGAVCPAAAVTAWNVECDNP